VTKPKKKAPPKYLPIRVDLAMDVLELHAGRCFHQDDPRAGALKAASNVVARYMLGEHDFEDDPTTVREPKRRQPPPDEVQQPAKVTK
jgi:hypothetical protein